MRFYFNIRSLYTPQGATALRGSDMRNIRHIEHAAMLVGEDGMLIAVGSEDEVSRELKQRTGDEGEYLDSVNCRGLVALPGFIDSHTHAVFMGERSMEFGMRAAGKSYQEIALAGGGIRSSVEQVRGADAQAIADYSRKYILSALALGTTTMEVKSGYGLSLEAELNLLEAARMLGGELTPMEVVRTFLGAHAVPKGVPQAEYVEQVVNEQLPKVAESHAAEFCDVFMDDGYFTAEETELIFNKALALGLKLRLHADELAETGAAELAVRYGCYSADHLLKVSDKGIAALAASERTIATLLPITALSLRAPYAPARKLIDAGCAVAIATDCNPGSSMSENMQLAVSLGVIGMQMAVEETLVAATLNGAAALGLAATHGSLEQGKQADMVFYDIPRLEYLPYHIGVSDVVSVMKRGEVVSGEVL